MALDIEVKDRPLTIHFIGKPVKAPIAAFATPEGPNQAIPEVYRWLDLHGVEPLSKPRYIYRQIGAADEPADVVMAIPVAEFLTPTDGLAVGTVPAGRYILARHTGHPAEISAAREEVSAWAKAEGIVLDVGQDPLLIGYLIDPIEQPDSSQWATDLLFRVSD